MATRYFRLLDPSFRTVSAVFRLRTDEEGLHVERFDPTADAWNVGPGTLLRFVNEGEVGADEISKAEAGRLIDRGLPPLPVVLPSPTLME